MDDKISIFIRESDCYDFDPNVGNSFQGITMRSSFVQDLGEKAIMTAAFSNLTKICKEKTDIVPFGELFPLCCFETKL